MFRLSICPAKHFLGAFLELSCARAGKMRKVKCSASVWVNSFLGHFLGHFLELSVLGQPRWPSYARFFYLSLFFYPISKHLKGHSILFDHKWRKLHRMPKLFGSSHCFESVFQNEYSDICAKTICLCEPLITKTSQELRMLSSVTLNCQVTKIVMDSGSQLSEL